MVITCNRESIFTLHDSCFRLIIDYQDPVNISNTTLT